MGKIKSVLFVCTGNSCRSVMAEALLKKRLKELGKTGIVVRSAGIRAIDGLPATTETIEVMKKEGVNLDAFESTGITDELIQESDLILVMSAIHRFEVIRQVPEAISKTFLLREYGRDKTNVEGVDMEIPDPIGWPASGYKICFDIIKEDVERVAKLL